MEDNYTKGKWFIEDERWTNQFGAVGIDISSNELGKCIITIWATPEADPEAEANARLVSASPSLYELAKQVERILFIRSAGDMLSSSEFEVLVKAREIIKEVEQ